MRTTKPTIITALLTTLALSLNACGREGDDEMDAASGTESYPLVQQKWRVPTIPVCWERSADAFSVEKTWVREKVEEQYEGRTRIQLTGWGRCTPGASGVRIGISDDEGDNPHTKGLGRMVDGVQEGMQLNFTFNNWSEPCRGRRRSCIQSIAVHEFGHAIGLAHEHNRPDTPTTCREKRQGTNGDHLVGGWDSASVMNYCNLVYNNNGALSAGDVRGIASLYGAK